MDKSLKLLIGSGIFLLLGACGTLILYILVDLPEEVAKPNAPIERAASRSQAVSAITPLPKQVSRAEVKSSQSSVTSPQPSSKKSFGPIANPVEEILGRTDTDFSATVSQLLAALPKLNPEQQAEAAEHIANLSDDTLAAQWAQKILSQTLPQSASEVLFNDLLNRPHAMLLPILSKLADMPKHPQSTQSVEILGVLFGQPPAGTSWGKWIDIKMKEEAGGSFSSPSRGSPGAARSSKRTAATQSLVAKQCWYRMRDQDPRSHLVHCMIDAIESLDGPDTSVSVLVGRLQHVIRKGH